MADRRSAPPDVPVGDPASAHPGFVDPRAARWPRPVGVLFDAGCTLVQPNVARLRGVLDARAATGPDQALPSVAELDAALWRTLALIDEHFGPDAGEHDAWFPRWLARLACEAGLAEADVAAAWREADRDQHLWDQPIDGARRCLERLRAAGVRTGVVSNADGRVAAALGRAGLAELLEVVVDSAVVGVAKPDPAVFAHALGPMALPPERTWYVGDTVSYDVAAADAAGLVSWVVDHRGLHTAPHGRRVASLDDFTDIVLGAGA